MKQAAYFLCGWTLLIVSCTSLKTDTPVRQQLQAEYDQIAAGFKGNDPEPWISRLTEGFKLKLFSGAEQSREWAVNYVRQNRTVFTVDSLRITIESVTPEAGGYQLARVRQQSSRTYRDESGKRMRLAVDVIQLERWKKSGRKWLLDHVTELEVLSLTRTPAS